MTWSGSSAVYLAAAAVYAGVVLFRFELGSGDAWRLGHLYYYDANDFATFVVSALPLGLYFAHAGRRLTVQLLAALALLLLTVAFVHTGSRGGFVALVAVGAFILLRYTAIAARWRVSTFLLVALLLVATASDQYWRQMGTIFSDSDYNQTEESGRLQIWRRGVGYMLQYPVLGVGPGNFQTAEGTLSPFAARQQFGVGVRWNAAHSSFVQVGAELGIAGLVFFVTLIASALAALRHAGRGRASRPGKHRSGSDAELTQALTASLVGFVVGAFFLSLAYSEMLYTLVALAVGLQKVTRSAQAEGVACVSDLPSSLPRVRTRARRLGAELYYGTLRTLRIPALRRRRRDAAVILCYHNVVAGDDDSTGAPGLHVRLDRFETQVRWLADHYAVVSLRELVRQRSARTSPPLAAITFDDGYAGTFEHAAPLLDRLGIPATVFVVAEAPGRPAGFWWDQPDVIRTLTPGLREQWLHHLRGDAAAILSEVGGAIRRLPPRDAAGSLSAGGLGHDPRACGRQHRDRRAFRHTSLPAHADRCRARIRSRGEPRPDSRRDRCLA